MQQYQTKQSETNEQSHSRFIQNYKLINIVKAALNRTFAEELDEIPSQLNYFQDGVSTHFINGLTGDDFEQRSKIYGTNQKPDPPSVKYWVFLYNQLMDLKAFLLILSSIVEIIIGNLTNIDHLLQIEGVILLTIAIVCCNILAINDYQNEKQAQSLKKVMESRKSVNVWRNGELTTLKEAQIMVGDIVQIQDGMEISVDCYLIEGSYISVDESAITGNSDYVRKDTYQNCIGVKDRIIKEGKSNQSSKYDVPSPIIFSGTRVIQGEGKMLVLVVGGQKLQAQKAIQDKGLTESPFEAKLEFTGNKIKNFELIFVTLIFFVSLIRLIINGFNKQSFGLQDLIAILRIIIIGITLLIFTNPYGARKILEFSVAYSITRALQDNILVKKKSSFLQLGLANQICTDKTGILTQNRFSVCCIWHNQIKQVNPYSQRFDLGDFIPKVIKDYFVLCVVLNNTAELDQDAGSKIDQSFVQFIQKCGINYQDLKQKSIVQKRFPYSQSRRRQSVIVDNNLFQYGSTELVLQSCTKFHSELGLVQIDDLFRKNLQEVLANMSSQALRTIALAYKEIQKEDNLEQVNSQGVYNIETQNLTLLCVIGIKDILRQEVPRCIKQMQNAGIKVRMITGDNLLRSVGLECGILIDENRSIEGNKFNNLIRGLVCKLCQTHNCVCPKEQQTANKTNRPQKIESIIDQQEFDDILHKLDILARASPEHKYTLVTGLIDRGFVVAVAGDGMNDAPALAKADIGIAMGIAGTDIARENSGIILLDDNFNSILKGIMWSRNIYESSKKFLQLQLTLNIVILSLILIGEFFIQQQVLYPIQIIWINLIVDIFASLALASEPPSYQILESQPDNLQQSLINPKMVKHIIGQAFFQLLILSFILFAGEQFIPEIQNSQDSQYPNQLQYKYSNIQILNNNGHQHCDYINTLYIDSIRKNVSFEWRRRLHQILQK